MARIEINFEEYKGLKNQIKKSSDAVAKLHSLLDNVDENYAMYEDIIEDLLNTTIVDRIFRWKEISEDVRKRIQKKFSK